MLLVFLVFWQRFFEKILNYFYLHFVVAASSFFYQLHFASQSILAILSNKCFYCNNFSIALLTSSLPCTIFAFNELLS